MSINQFSTELPETLWWAQNHHHHHHQSLMEPNQNPSTHKPLITNPNSSSWPTHLYYQQHHSYPNPYNNNTHQPRQMSSSAQNTSLSFNLNHQEIENDDQEPLDEQNQERGEHIEKEPMFEKPLTPSDVGKLNRLVIPKQHAEKYFPLGGDSVEKGLLLSFEDELGKFWRFRYSYWNSSQSYVLTKGWSRYVKEKQLDAGDVVLFERHRIDGERLFIGWRRRGESGSGLMVHGNSGGVWSRGLLYSQQHQQPCQLGHGANVSTRVPYQPDCLHAGSSGDNQAIPIVGNSKRLRLFGVNLECQLEDSSSTEPSTPDGSSMSSQQGPQHLHHFHSSYYSSNTSSQSHMEIAFSRDVNEMRNRRG